MLLAARVFAGYSTGNLSNFYYFGGLNTLRGYDFRSIVGNRAAFANAELRFPLIDVLAFPGFAIQGIRGNLFLDVGGATFGGQPYHFMSGGKLQDGKAAVGWGLSFNLLGLELHWDFARRTDLKHAQGKYRTEFWIGKPSIQVSGVLPKRRADDGAGLRWSRGGISGARAPLSTFPRVPQAIPAYFAQHLERLAFHVLVEHAGTDVGGAADGRGVAELLGRGLDGALHLSLSLGLAGALTFHGQRDRAEECPGPGPKIFGGERLADDRLNVIVDVAVLHVAHFPVVSKRKAKALS